MNPRQTIAEKRQFVLWFLRTQNLKHKPAEKILKILAEDPELLARAKFVNDISSCRNALMISAEGTEGYPFLCRIDNQYYHLAEEAIEALRNSTSIIYVCLNFQRCFPCTIPGLIANIETGETGNFAELAEQELEAYLKQKEQKRQQLLVAIDDALDRRDESAFLALSTQLIVLDEK